MRRFLIAAALLFGCVMPADSAVRPALVDVTPHDAPIHITASAVYGNDSEHLYCVSFSAVGKTATHVTFKVSEGVRGKGRVDVLLQRDGTFSPGVEIRSPQGEPLSAGDYRKVRENCAVFTTATVDVLLRTVEVESATTIDGVVWTPPAPKPVPTVAPDAADTSPAPPWDAGHHAGYIAVVVNAAASRTPAVLPQINIYAPGHGAPSATISSARCCFIDIGFDGAGNLYAATTQDGEVKYSVGSTSAPTVISTQNGIALAVNAAGDSAIGGIADTPTVVTPASGAQYALPYQAVPGGIAIAPDGEVTIIDSGDRVRTFPKGSTTQSRQFLLYGGETPKGSYPLGALAYDAQGELGVLDVRGAEFSLYPRDARRPSWQMHIAGALGNGMAFGPNGDLDIINAFFLQRYERGNSKPVESITSVGHGLVVGADGRRALIYPVRNRIEIYDASGKESFIPGVVSVHHFAISP